MNISEWIKTIAAAVGGALAWLFGAWDPLIMVLVAVMVLDYVTGRSRRSSDRDPQQRSRIQGIAEENLYTNFGGTGSPN